MKLSVENKNRDWFELATALSVITGCLVLIGWAFDLPAFKSLSPGLPSMNPNTAVSLFLAGASLRLLGGVADGIPSYFSLDVRLAWRARKNLEISVVGQNLLDNHHPEFGTSPLVRSPLVEIRRDVYGKATWSF